MLIRQIHRWIHGLQLGIVCNITHYRVHCQFSAADLSEDRLGSCLLFLLNCVLLHGNLSLVLEPIRCILVLRVYLDLATTEQRTAIINNFECRLILYRATLRVEVHACTLAPLFELSLLRQLPFKVSSLGAYHVFVEKLGSRSRHRKHLL